MFIDEKRMVALEYIFYTNEKDQYESLKKCNGNDKEDEDVHMLRAERYK